MLVQNIKKINRLIIGIKENIKKLEVNGLLLDLNINFSPSITGCKMPQIIILFGPRRRCDIPIKARSSNVIKATDISTLINIKVN